MSPLDERIIDRLQAGIDVVERPFEALGAALDIDARSLIERTRQLLDEGILTRFGPMFNMDALGGGYSLCAMAVPEARFECVCETLNARPEVAHNYAREHAFNMWFVIATENPDSITQVLDEIAAQTGIPVLNLPKEEEYRVGLRLETRGRSASANPNAKTIAAETRLLATALPDQAKYRMDEIDRNLFVHSQAGLPLCPEPYAEIAKKLGLTPSVVMRRFTAMLAAGAVRRIAGVPNHYRLGYRANGMSVWDVSDEHIRDAGRDVARLAFVSHCYRRPRQLPDWPYNLFAMVHGRTRENVDDQVAQIARCLEGRARAHDVLFSTRILKKTGVRLPQGV